MPDSFTRATALRILGELLDALPGYVVVTVSGLHGPPLTTITLPPVPAPAVPADRAPAANGQEPAGPSGLPCGEIADRIRAALRAAARPLKVGAIARAAGKNPPSAWFREVLRRLVACGEVLHLAGHYYWPAARQLPAGRTDRETSC